MKILTNNAQTEDQYTGYCGLGSLARERDLMGDAVAVPISSIFYGTGNHRRKSVHEPRLSDGPTNINFGR